VVLNMSPKSAEQLKRDFGCVCCSSEKGEETVSIRTTAGRIRTLTRYQLSEIIEARQQEILEFVRRTLEDSGSDRPLAAGLILTGGGALLQGLPQLGEEVLGMPIRIGVPQNVIAPDSMQDPHFATAIGLLQFAMDEHPEEARLPAQSSPRARLMDRLNRLFSFI